MNNDEMLKLIEQGDLSVMLSALDETDPASKSKLVKTAITKAKQFEKEEDENYKPPESTEQWMARSTRLAQQKGCATLVVFRLGAWDDIKRLGRSLASNGFYNPTVLESVTNILYKYRPEWIERLVDQILRDNWSIDWTWIRTLVRDGVCRRPTSIDYVKSMLLHGRSLHEKKLVDFLRDDPGMLEAEIWSLFETLPIGNEMLILPEDLECEHESYFQSWGHALQQLADEGEIDRNRLIAAPLQALRLNRKPSDCVWFYRFHELLQPTPDERAAYQPLYSDLLSNPVSAVAKFALDALCELAKAGRLDARQFLGSIESIFRLPTKGTSIAALKLLEQIAKSDESLKVDIALAAASGLDHESQDVQKASLAVIENLKLAPNAEVASAIESRLEGTVASLRERARKLATTLAGASEKPAGNRKAASSESPQPIASTNTAAVQSSSNDSRTTPSIQTLDELIDEASTIIEKFNGPERLERFLDGLSRLCDQRPSDFAKRTRPLKARIDDLRDFLGFQVDLDSNICSRLVEVVLAWLTGKPQDRAATDFSNDFEPLPPPPKTYQEPSKPAFNIDFLKLPEKDLIKLFEEQFHSHYQPVLAVLEGRLTELGDRLQRCDARPLLAAPSHVGGWVSADALIQRLQFFEEQGLDPQSFDLRQALLRLSSKNRDEVLGSAHGFTGSRQRVIEWALDRIKPAAATDVAVYVAAKAGRDPFAPMLASDNPPVLEPLRFTWNVVPLHGDGKEQRWGLAMIPNLNAFENPLFRVPPLTLCAIANRAGDVAWPEGKAACLAQVWPINPDPFFAAGAVRVVASLETTSAIVRFHPDFLKPMFESRVAFSEMAQVLLAVSLLAKSNDQRGMAVDALIALIDDGRCAGGELGTVFQKLLPSKMIRCNRLADSFAVTSRVSPRHALACSRIVQTLFGGLAELPDDAHHLLTPLVDWLAELQQPLELPFRQSLSQINGKTKSAKLAQILLK